MGVAAVLSLVAGCQSFGSGSSSLTSGPNVRDDVVGVFSFKYPAPFLKADDGRVGGIRTRVYFQSAATGKGVFVPGIIEIELFGRQRKPDGGYVRVPLHTWTFDPRSAEGFRIPKEAVPGFGYGFFLYWPESLDVAGQTVDLRISYRRLDGRYIRSTYKEYQVPPPARDRVSDAPATSAPRTTTRPAAPAPAPGGRP